MPRVIGTDRGSAARSAAPETAGPVTFTRETSPARTIVEDSNGAVVAVLTDGARTVVFSGPERTFAEPTATDAVVRSTSWVRFAPQEWSDGSENATWFPAWFGEARGDTGPDLFAIAFQYVREAPALTDNEGIRYAGDASYGPLKRNGVGRSESNDFYDYLGVSWSFPDRDAPEQPEERRYGSVDCSGFVRMVTGYRMGYPLRGTNDPGPGLPRRAWAIMENGPGVELVPDTGSTATDFSTLQPGDLVVFEIDPEDPELDHIGIYLGVDDQGERRFISSRSKANGPTMGDIGGNSVLDDGSFYARGFRGARRI